MSRWIELGFVGVLAIMLAVWLLDVVILRRRRQATGREAPWFIEYTTAFLPLLAIVVVVRSFVVDPFRIPSDSMMPTLENGDFILVNKFAYGMKMPGTDITLVPVGQPRRGDVVVFRYPGMGASDKDKGLDYIKRVVGLPGDVVKVSKGRVWINGKEIPHVPRGPVDIADGTGMHVDGAEFAEDLAGVAHAVRYHAASLEQGGQRDGEYPVPAGHYFVMGDNRDNSLDSRFWGALPADNLRGKAFLIWMHWNDGVQTDRIGQRVR